MVVRKKGFESKVKGKKRDKEGIRME